MNDLNQIKKYYSNLDDQKVIKIAQEDVKKLKSGVVEILIDEIERRGLGDSLLSWVRAESRVLSEEDFAVLVNKIKTSKCSICDRKDSELKGYTFTTIIGIVKATLHKNYSFIVCETCGREKRSKSLNNSLMMGWWSVKGFFTMPFLLFDKMKSAMNEDEESEKLLREFILQNVGHITLGDDSEETISHLIYVFNQMNVSNSDY